MTITVNNNRLIFQSDGIPSHEVLDSYLGLDAQGVIVTTIGSVDLNIAIPLNPALADSTTETNASTIGFALSGAVFYNPYEGGADRDTVANDDNFTVDGVPFIDGCGGHPDPHNGGMYHYHGIPYCVSDAVDTAGQHSVLIGYLLDGFPVYGPQDIDGNAPTDLDDCHGHFGVTPEFPEGTYHYHMLDVTPYSVPCYSGSPLTGGPPGGGPPPNSGQ